MRLRKLGTWAIVLGSSLPAWAAEQPGAISGYVRNVSGHSPDGRRGADSRAANRTLTVFTDGAGYYTATGLLPGLYTSQSYRSFIPAGTARKSRPASWRQPQHQCHAEYAAGSDAAGPVRRIPDDDDWKWTLRSVANRPILRVFDDPNATAVSAARSRVTI